MDLITRQEYDNRTLVSIYLAGRTKNTVKNYRCGIQHLHGFLVQRGLSPEETLEPLSKVNLLIAKAFVTEAMSKYSGSTVGVWVSGLVGLYDLFVEYGKAIENPFRHPLVQVKAKHRKPIKPTPRIPLPEVRALLASQYAPALPSSQPTRITLRNRAMLSCLLGGGLRRSELMKLKLGDVIAGTYITLRLYYTKGAVLEEQSLPDWCTEALMDWCAVRAMEGGSYDDSLFELSLEGLHKAWKRIVWAAGIKDYGLHACRCTAINTLFENGHSEEHVRDFSRHKNVTTTRGYKRFTAPSKNIGRSLSYGN
jgi:integrase